MTNIIVVLAACCCRLEWDIHGGLGEPITIDPPVDITPILECCGTSLLARRLELQMNPTRLRSLLAKWVSSVVFAPGFRPLDDQSRSRCFGTALRLFIGMRGR
nr:uncharacterized protein LOC112289141 [Physcomitrium patens]|eukprot:XP_024389874.1 uncharacterized protein LOC112289141 [Physcomitrella patens]